MSNKIKNYAAKCTNCEHTTVIKVVQVGFDYDKWIANQKRRYTNGRVHLQLSHAVNISIETSVDPNVILEFLIIEFWKHWDWHTHIKVVRRDKVFLTCYNCKNHLDMPNIEAQEEQEATNAAEELKAFAAFSCGFLNGDPTSIVDYTAHLVKFLKDNKDWISNLED